LVLSQADGTQASMLVEALGRGEGENVQFERLPGEKFLFGR